MTIDIATQKTKNTIWWGFLLLWIIRYVQGLLLHQLHGAPFVSVEADNFFWLWHGLQLVCYSIENYTLAIGLDGIWLLLALIGITGRSKWWLNLIFLFVFTNYFVCFNSVATHHEHTLIGFLFLQFLFLVYQYTSFVLTFATIRYYVLFSMVNAGVWKVWRGSAFYYEQLEAILKIQHLDYLTTYPENTYSHFIYYLIHNPSITASLWTAAWGIELFFLVGFFTKRLDTLLGYLFLLFFLGDYIIMDISFLEFCIFAIVFFPAKGIWDHYNELALEVSVHSN